MTTFSNLLRGPLFGRVFRHIKVHDSPSVMGENDEDEQHPEPSSRHGKEVDAICFMWFFKNGRQVCDGGLRFRRRYFPTVDRATSIPSLSSSP